MGNGEKTSPINFHPLIHFHHHGHSRRGIPKGSVAITVGQGPEQQRFIIPIQYVNHPLFSQLLIEAEAEYGFDQKGPINIPCNVDEFCHVRCLIDKETAAHHHQYLCFRA